MRRDRQVRAVISSPRWRHGLAAWLSAGAILTSWAIALPGVAKAGDYKVNSCLAAPQYSTAAFQARATRGTRIKRGCNPHGPGLRGLVTYVKAGKGRGRRVPRGTRATLTFRAPPGTQFVRFRWTGKRARSDCGYTASVYADGPRIKPRSIGRTLAARRHCPRGRRAQAADRDGGTFNVTGANRIVQTIVCRGASAHKRSCSSRGRNYVLTRSATATLRDVTAPAVRVTGNPFAGGWVNGTETLTYIATDNTGIRAGRAISGTRQLRAVQRPCSFVVAIPCHNGPDRVPVDTSLLSEGTQLIRVQALDSAGNPGYSKPVIARVDRTAPGRVAVGAVGGEGWRRTPGTLLSWTNPAERDRAPIVGAFYQTRRLGEPQWSAAKLAGGGNLQRLSLQPPVGQTQVRLWRRDSAGNASEALASEPVTLRYDPEAPNLAFRRSAPSDPTRVVVAVTERVSGIASGQIEVSRRGSNTWRSLATQREKGQLVANVDDSRLAAGAYQVRAQASDLAGNVGVASRPGTLTLPLRIGSSLRAGIAKHKTVKRKVRRHGRRRTVRRRVVVLHPRARVRFGRRVRIAGRLTNADGQPLAGQPVSVYSQTPVTGPRLVGRVQTSRRGRYAYIAKATATRTVSFVYAGTRLQLPAVSNVRLLVPAASTIRASRRRVSNGSSVLFRGRVRSIPVPTGGKLIELQAHFRHRWRTFQTVRSDAGGRWRFRYRFGGTVGKVRYPFRVRLPREGGYPFVGGHSRRTTVTVVGR